MSQKLSDFVAHLFSFKVTLLSAQFFSLASELGQILEID